MAYFLRNRPSNAMPNRVALASLISPICVENSVFPGLLFAFTKMSMPAFVFFGWFAKRIYVMVCFLVDLPISVVAFDITAHVSGVLLPRSTHVFARVQFDWSPVQLYERHVLLMLMVSSVIILFPGVPIIVFDMFLLFLLILSVASVVCDNNDLEYKFQQ